MQARQNSRTNRERSAATRKSLIEAGLKLWTESSYADVTTPHICKAAGVTRGALYHHFEHKLGLFRAVIENEYERVGTDIEQAASVPADPRTAIMAGAEAFFDAMSMPGRTRLLFIEAPAVLGADAMAEIDSAVGEDGIRLGLVALLPSSDDQLVRNLAALLSAGFDRLAIHLAAGGSKKNAMDAIDFLLGSLVEKG